MSGKETPLAALSPVRRPKKPGLRHAHGKIAGVIQDKDLEWQVVMNHGLQLLDVHLNAAVSSEADDALSGTGKSRSDGGRQVVAHRSGPGIRDTGAGLAQTHGLERNDAGSCIAADYDVVAAKPGRELFDEVIRIQGRPGLTLAILHDRVASDAFTAPRQPWSVNSCAVVCRVTLDEAAPAETA